MPEKKKTSKKKAPVKKVAAKKATAKKTAAKKGISEKSSAQRPAAKQSKATAKKSATGAKSSVSKRSKAPSTGSAFSLEEALSVAKSRDTESKAGDDKKAAKEKARKAIEEAEQRTEKRVLGAASLEDILGYNPVEAQSESRTVPKKFERYYNLLIELRDHVKTGLNMHTEETLKRSSKDDSGDLSSYGQHMADAGTDTFDRDFALSMVSSEQEALHEVESAIERIFNDTYGVCEMTGKPIQEERLMAVPFTRYSVETQAQLEKNRIRSVQRGGVFSEASSEDAVTFSDENSDT